MKKFYQDSDSYVHVAVTDRERLADIFCEYGLFVFNNSVRVNGAACVERITCTSFRDDLDLGCDSLDFLCEDSETWVSIMGKFEGADVFFSQEGRSAVVFLKIEGLEEIEFSMENGPVLITAAH